MGTWSAATSLRIRLRRLSRPSLLPTRISERLIERRLSTSWRPDVANSLNNSSRRSGRQTVAHGACRGLAGPSLSPSYSATGPAAQSFRRVGEHSGQRGPRLLMLRRAARRKCSGSSREHVAADPAQREKIGAQIRVTVRRVWISLAEGYAYARLLTQV